MDSAQAAATDNAQLVLHEREARGRGWWDRIRDCYHPDAAIRVAWFEGNAAEFVTGSERMAAHGDPTLHQLSPPAACLSGGRALVTMGAAIDSRLAVHGVEGDLVVYGRFLYRREQRGYTINQQLPGDDRPSQVAALYQDAFTWAGLEPPGPAGHEGTGDVQHR
jgi:hypothetical protein